MEPNEIVTILNANRHDGEIDWSHFFLRGQGCYWSKNQRLKWDYTCNLSQSSAEIIAAHYHAAAILKESDE